MSGGQSSRDVRYSSNISTLIWLIVTVAASETTDFPVVVVFDVVVVVVVVVVIAASAAEHIVIADVPASVIARLGSETQMFPSAVLFFTNHPVEGILVQSFSTDLITPEP